MASGSDQPWPFLAILSSGGERIRGLGFAYDDVVVTLEHIAESADSVSLGGERSTQSARPGASAGGLALMVLAQPPPEQAQVRRGGEEVSVAIVSDISPSIRLVEGRAGPPGADGRFTVTLDGRLGDDETASGSPIVAGDAVIGIVGPTATSGSVDAYGAEAILGLRESVVMGPTELTPPTLAAVAHAIELSAELGAAAATILGVLRSGADDVTETVPAQLLAWIDERREGGPLARDIDRLRAQPPVDPETITDPQIADSPVGPIVLAADAVRTRVGDGRLHRRHLLAAALGDRAALPERLDDVLGVRAAELRVALRDVIARTYAVHDAWDELLDGAPAFALTGGMSADLVDPTAGIPLEDDHLGLGVDVTMFAALIADVATPLPLSVGLFGEWGSGKSYFMGLLRAEIERLARSADPSYCDEIVQIGFNAWHYADSNLWASLGDEIFEQLAGPQGDAADERRAALRADLDDKLQRRKELIDAKARAEAEKKRLTTELDDAAAKRWTSAGDLATAALRAPGLREELDSALDDLGVADQDDQVRLLAAEIERAPQDVADIRRAVARLPRGTIVAAFAIAAAAVVAGVAASKELAGVGIAAVTLLTSAGAIIARVRSGAALLHQVAEGLRRGQHAAVGDEVAALRQAETNERVVQSQLDDVIAQAAELRRELAEHTPGQRLYRFVAERAASDTYRGQLGLISTIRRDFEQLRKLMKEDWPASGDDARRPIDRIVLYIDDLDRCSPRQVVDVLQAVHLLLALDLFVVVVGVDPRWLLHSLRREYRSLLTTAADDGGDVRWQSTPQDYLEKIFNIPFALPRMTATSFEQLVGSFAETEPGGLGRIEGPFVKGPSLVIPHEDGEPTTIDIGELAAAAAVEEHSEVAGIQARAEAIERRGLTVGELKMLTALAPLVETPRETKRLVNLYRMLRSTRDLSPAARFLGDEDIPGEYQAVVILLGLLSGHATLLHDVLVAPATDTAKGGLRCRAPGESWGAFASGLAPRPGGDGFRNEVVAGIPAPDLDDWTRLAQGLEDASALVTIPDLRPFQAWAPRIARFSFLLSPYADEVGAMSPARSPR